MALQRLVVYGNDQPEATARADDIAQLRGSGVVGLVHPIDGQKAFEAIPTAGDAGAFFNQALSFLSSWMISSVLAGFLGLASASTGGRGAYSLSQDQSDFYLKSRQAVAKEIAESLSYDVVRPLVMLNFGADAAYPQCKFGPLQDEQAQALLTMFGQLSAAPVLHVPLQVFDLITERMASILQLDVDQVHNALVSTASQRAEQLAGNPPPGMPAGGCCGAGAAAGPRACGDPARPAGGGTAGWCTWFAPAAAEAAERSCGAAEAAAERADGGRPAGSVAMSEGRRVMTDNRARALELAVETVVPQGGHPWERAGEVTRVAQVYYRWLERPLAARMLFTITTGGDPKCP